MKKIAFLILLISFCYSTGFSAAPCGVTGADWYSTTLSAPFAVRHELGCLAFNNKMWVIGGGGPVWPNEKDVWSSADGANWTLENSSAAFGTRGAGGYLVFDNGTGPKMWIIGGEKNGAWQKDVWYSSNGVDWLMATGNAAFGARECQAVYVYNNKMWIAGGFNGADMNDVWWSSNGADWFRATASAPWSPRSYPAFAVYDDGTGAKMWIIGGQTIAGGAVRSDTWYSSDGAAWTQAAGNFQTRYQARAEVFDGKLWIMGGIDGAGAAHSDVWYTVNGFSWTQATGTASFGTRSDGATCVFDNRMWYVAGMRVGVTNLKDVWYTCGSSTQTPVPTDTAVVIPPTVTPTDTATPTPTYTLLPTDTSTPAPDPTSIPVNTPACGTIGVDWNSAVLSAPFAVRHELGCLVYNNRMWVIGGGGPVWPNEKDVWSSADGANWKLENGSAAFGPRGAGGYLVFDNGTGPKMWLIAGERDGAFQKDVWSSSNGVDWLLVTGNAAFGPRAAPAAFVYNNKMWMAGGNSGGADVNDVWWSSNGADWYRAASNAPWSPRSYPACAVYDNGTGPKMWIIGGANMFGPSVFSDTWYSSDGAAWTRAANDFQVRYEARAEVFDGKLWVIGGIDGAVKAQSDVWYTNDGASWTKATGAAAFNIRSDGATCVFDGRMWYVAGMRVGVTNLNDVWYTCGNSIQTPVPTAIQTDTPVYTATSVNTATPVNTATSVNTDTPVKTSTPVPVFTATPTPKPEPTVRDGDSSCYPTRAKDHVKIVFNTEKKADCRIYVYDISGKLVKTVDLKTGTTPNEKLYKVQLDVRGFEPGVYYYTIQCRCDNREKVNFKSQKFIVKGSK